MVRLPDGTPRATAAGARGRAPGATRPGRRGYCPAGTQLEVISMPKRTAEARWDGSLQEGNGTMRMASGAYEGPYSFQSRFQEGDGTNPEELIAAAHAGCFSMALSLALGQAGHSAESVETTATVHLDKLDE